jgi:hypothetical protein
MYQTLGNTQAFLMLTSDNILFFWATGLTPGPLDQAPCRSGLLYITIYSTNLRSPANCTKMLVDANNAYLTDLNFHYCVRSYQKMLYVPPT